MADPSAPPSPMWDAIKAIAPSIGQSLVMIVGLLVAIGTTYWVAKPEKPEPAKIVMVAADPPRPTPIACAQDFHDLTVEAAAIKAQIAGLRQLVEERLPAPKAATLRKAAAR